MAPTEYAHSSRRFSADGGVTSRLLGFGFGLMVKGLGEYVAHEGTPGTLGLAQCPYRDHKDHVTLNCGISFLFPCLLCVLTVNGYSRLVDEGRLVCRERSWRILVEGADGWRSRGLCSELGTDTCGVGDPVWLGVGCVFCVFCAFYWESGSLGIYFYLLT